MHFSVCHAQTWLTVGRWLKSIRQERESHPVPLIPIYVIVFLGFSSIGIPLPLLSTYTHTTLGFDSLVVGLIIGTQWVVTLLTRHFSGTWADAHGAKSAVVFGLVLAVVASAVYALSAWFAAGPAAALLILLAGSALLGFAESLLIIGALSWGVALLGPRSSGRIMAYISASRLERRRRSTGQPSSAATRGQPRALLRRGASRFAG